ncbi:hypothetical protein ABFA07_014222 [Porites harrisoni]
MEGGASKPPSEAIIVLSSDDDEDEDVQELFKQFIVKAERHIPHNVVVFLKVKFAEAPSDFVSSTKFKSSLKWRTKQLDESNAFIFTGDVCKLLGADLKQDEFKSKTEGVKKAEQEAIDGVFSTARNKITNRVEENVNKDAVRLTTDCSDGKESGSVVRKRASVKTATEASTSSAEFPTSVHVEVTKEGKSKRKTNGTTDPSRSKLSLTPRKRQVRINRLKEKLKHVSDKIKILNQAELSLEEMNMSDSTYIQECRLKERFNKIWAKLCKIRGRPTDTGRVIEKDVKCPSTGFPEIDRAVNKFLKKKRGRFPDKFDISRVIQDAKREHGLKISSQALREISDEVFVAIGNKLQERRKLDFSNNFGCHLTDDYSANNDPAINDLALQRKLEENKKISKRALEDVFNKYAHYGRMKNEGSDASSSSDSEREKSQNSKMKRKFSRVSVQESSDSSENERDDFGLDFEDPNEDKTYRSKSVLGKRDKGHSIRKLSYTSENDLDDFAFKRPHHNSERTNHTESKSRQTAENHHLPATKRIELTRDCAVVEIPSSVLSESISIEQVEAVDVRQKCSNDNYETTAESNVLDNSEISSVPDTPQSDDVILKDQQINDCVKSRDSNLDDEVLTARSVDFSASSNDQASPGMSRSGTDVLDDTVASSSDVSSDVSNKISTKTSGKPTVEKRKDLREALSPENSVSNSQSDNPNVVPSVSLKDRKPSMLSLSIKKRKAEGGSLEYESPLKVFRNATLEIVGKKDNILNAKGDTSEQKANCGKIASSSKSEDDELYITGTNVSPSQGTVNGHSHVQNNEPRKSSLSLKKNGRKTPKKVEIADEIIVLSDDE